MDEDLVLKVVEEWRDLTMDEQAMIWEDMPGLADALNNLMDGVRDA